MSTRDWSVTPRHLTTEWLGSGDGIAVQDHILARPVALHWHEFFEVSYVVSGTGWHGLNGRRRPLRPGDVLALTPADVHELRPNPGGALRLTNVIHTDEMLPPPLRVRLPAPPTVHLPHMAADFERLATESRHHDQISALAIRATLTRVLADVVRAASAGDLGAEEQLGRRSDLDGAIAWLDHHFREPVRLADVAAVAGLSANHFSGVFRRATGMSFQEYLINRRLQFARSLLASGLPVTKACHAAGFGDLTHFGRSYRRRFGYPPSAEPGRAHYAEPPEGRAPQPEAQETQGMASKVGVS